MTPTEAPPARKPPKGMPFAISASVLLHGAAAALLIAAVAGADAPPPPPITITAAVDASITLEPDLERETAPLPEPDARLRPETLLDPLDVPDEAPPPFAEEAAPRSVLPAGGPEFGSRPSGAFPAHGRRADGVGGADAVGGGGGGGSNGASAGAASARAPVFVAARPRKGDCRRPDYPRSAREGRVEGSVRLRLVVSEDGSVLSVAVEVPSGSEALDDAAASAARDWRFEPATEDGAPVLSTVLVPVSFRISGTPSR